MDDEKIHAMSRKAIVESLSKREWMTAKEVGQDLFMNPEFAALALSDLIKEGRVMGDADERGIIYYRLVKIPIVIDYDDGDNPTEDTPPEPIPEKPPEAPPMQNAPIQTTDDVRKFLLDQMKLVATGQQTPEQAKAVCGYVQQVYNITTLEMKYAKAREDHGSVKAIELTGGK